MAAERIDKAMTKRELANLAGRSYQWMYTIDRDLEKNQKLFVESEKEPKKYDLAMFVQRWAEYNRRDRNDAPGELSMIKAQHEMVKKEKTAIEVAKMKGETVRIHDVDRLWSDIVSVVRGRLIMMPKKLAMSLMMLDDTDRIEEILDREIRDALQMISQTPLPETDGEMRTAEAGDENEENDGDQE